MSLVNDPHEYNDQVYDLNAREVADIAGRSLAWVRDHPLALGGVLRRWSGKTTKQATWRFPSEGLDERIFRVKGGK